ncbi:hypothetical protein GCM10009850_110300 [Nonomuraea monospora]|uniref:Uncharacterized protein n=1 Tax=Nonomuraea monospora TaxID=568818 RepID=A0ABP5PYV8_9ACTN
MGRDQLEGAMPLVSMTEAGDRYHSSRDCIGLQAGQDGGAVQGYELRPVVKVAAGGGVGEDPVRFLQRVGKNLPDRLETLGLISSIES